MKKHVTKIQRIILIGTLALATTLSNAETLIEEISNEASKDSSSYSKNYFLYSEKIRDSLRIINSSLPSETKSDLLLQILKEVKSFKNVQNTFFYYGIHEQLNDLEQLIKSQNFTVLQKKVLEIRKALSW